MHYEQHFEDSPQAVDKIVIKPGPTALDRPSSSKPSSSKRSQGKWKLGPFRENDVFWYPSQARPPPSTYTPGLIPIIRKSLLVSHSRGDLRKAALCYDQTVFIQKEAWDAAWGCGYRNFLMACAALMAQPFQPMYFPLLDAPISPGIRNLQNWIEEAWNAGFDVEGKAQLNKLVGTRKWIGTSDLYTAFSYRGIPAELVDFHLEDESQGVQLVIDWVVNYFTPVTPIASLQRNAFDALKSTAAVVSTDLMPVILQHNGHSRLIVGYEVDKQGSTNLLTFDCGVPLRTEIKQAALSNLPSSLSPDSKDSKLKRQASSSPMTSGDTKRSRSIGSASGADSDDNEIQIVGERNVGRTGLRQSNNEAVVTGFTSPLESMGSTSIKPKSNVSKEPDYRSIIRHFRLSTKKLGQKKQYQILYFPLTSPLLDRERNERKVVTSTKIC